VNPHFDHLQIHREIRPARCDTTATKLLDEAAETAAKACSFTGETLVLMADGTAYLQPPHLTIAVWSPGDEESVFGRAVRRG
jgi:hypothetical protein